jgi:hypothetical protein
LSIRGGIAGVIDEAVAQNRLQASWMGVSDEAKGTRIGSQLPSDFFLKSEANLFGRVLP